MECTQYSVCRTSPLAHKILPKQVKCYVSHSAHHCHHFHNAQFSLVKIHCTGGCSVRRFSVADPAGRSLCTSCFKLLSSDSFCELFPQLWRFANIKWRSTLSRGKCEPSWLAKNTTTLKKDNSMETSWRPWWGFLCQWVKHPATTWHTGVWTLHSTGWAVFAMAIFFYSVHLSNLTPLQQTFRFATLQTRKWNLTIPLSLSSCKLCAVEEEPQIFREIDSITIKLTFLNTHFFTHWMNAATATQFSARICFSLWPGGSRHGIWRRITKQPREDSSWNNNFTLLRVCVDHTHHTF